MYRFLHAADLHLDSPLRGLDAHDGAPTERIRGATRQAFVALVDRALEEEVAFVLLAGDLYDGQWRDYATGIFLSGQLGRLDRAGIPVIAVTGNHDAQSKITRSLSLPPNTTILKARAPETVVLQDMDPPVAIHGQSYPKPHVDQDLAAGYPPPVPDHLNIGMLHTSLDGRPGHAPYAPCTAEELAAHGYAYWALGHVHAPDIVRRDPLIVFPGCLQGRHIRETGPKGAVLVTVHDAHDLQAEAIPLDVLRWEQLDVDLSGVPTAEQAFVQVREALSRALDGADDRLLGVRVVLSGATPAARRFSGDLGALRAQIQALAAEVGGQDLFVEKVVLALREPTSMEDTVAAHSALGELLQEIHDLPDEPAAVEGLEEVLKNLQRKLPREARDPDEAEALRLDLDDPAFGARIVREAKALLWARLLGEGEAP